MEIVHPRFGKLNELTNKYSHKLLVGGRLDSPRNLLKLACFKNDKTVVGWSTFRVSPTKHIIFYNRK